MGDMKIHRHHDQGRLLGCLQRLPHGQTAENVAKQWQLSARAGRIRRRSQNKAEAAQKAGKFKDEIVAVTIKTRKGDTVVERRRVHQARRDHGGHAPSCARPSTRKAR
jgi:acetyl-CoA C-acetyltransferase